MKMTSTLPDPRPPTHSRSEVIGDQISLQMPSKEEAVRPTINSLLEFLRAQRPFHPELHSEVEIVLAEILNNVVEHGHARIEEGIATVSISIQETELKIEIIDRGHPMPNMRLPEENRTSQAPAQMPLQDLPEGGFGWALIRMLAKRIGYQRIDGQNRLTVVMAMPTN